MEKLKVKNAKNFALTAGKEYEVLGKDGDRIRIINDKNIQAFYYPSVFAEAAPAVTQASVMASITITPQQVRYNVGGNNVHIPCSLSQAESEASCGVREIYGINSLYELLEDKVEQIQELSPAERRIVVMELFKKKLVQKVNAQTGAMALFSTNTNFSNFSEIDDIITSTYPDHVGLIANNANGGNDIKTWLVPLSQFIL